MNAARLNDRQGWESHSGHPTACANFFNALKRGLKRFERITPEVEAMATQARRLTRQKIALIHVAAHQLGMGDEDYRALLMRAAGVRSARDLDLTGFEAVMRRFEALGFTSARALAPQYGERPGMASTAQVRAIRALWKAWHHAANARSDASESARALRHWLVHSFGVSDLRFCDVATARKAIEGLKAMTARTHHPKGARHE